MKWFRCYNDKYHIAEAIKRAERATGLVASESIIRIRDTDKAICAVALTNK